MIVALAAGSGFVTATMAMRMANKSKSHKIFWSAVNRSVQPSGKRKFACTAVRVKDVAAEEPLPNMRHATRPRTIGPIAPWN